MAKDKSQRRPVAEFFAMVQGMGKEMGLEGEKLDKYVSDHMTAKGYKPLTSWAEPDGDEGESESNPFSGLGGNSGGSKKSSGWF